MNPLPPTVSLENYIPCGTGLERAERALCTSGSVTHRKHQDVIALSCRWNYVPPVDEKEKRVALLKHTRNPDVHGN